MFDIAFHWFNYFSVKVLSDCLSQGCHGCPACLYSVYISYRTWLYQSFSHLPHTHSSSVDEFSWHTIWTQGSRSSPASWSYIIYCFNLRSLQPLVTKLSSLNGQSVQFNLWLLVNLFGLVLTRVDGVVTD